MNKIKNIMRFALPAIVAAGLFIGTTSGAGANASGVVVFPTATATTVPLFFPASGPPVIGSWSIVGGPCTGSPGACGTINLAGTLGPVVSTVGAYCGASSGVGTGTALGHSGVGVSWVSSVGSVFPVTVTGTGHAAVVVLVQVSPTTPTDCAGGGATSFNVRIAAAIA